MHGQSTDRWERAPGAAAAPIGGYPRREPERTLLHAALRAHLEPFIDAACQTGSGWGPPGHVERELRGCLDCGLLARGFARVR